MVGYVEVVIFKLGFFFLTSVMACVEYWLVHESEPFLFKCLDRVYL